jgi:hypothetical protein
MLSDRSSALFGWFQVAIGDDAKGFLIAAAADFL